jgi:predicted negative regulator of RcsB-dependent stress response
MGFLQENYLKIALAVLAVIVVIVGYSIYQRGQANARETAGTLLFQGQSFLAKGANEPARQKLQECIDRFGGTTFGKQARLELAQVLLAKGENQVALVTVEEGLSLVDPATPLHQGLQLAQATALVNLERFPEAEAIYRQLLATNPGDYKRMEWTMRLADCLKLGGRPQEGLAVLENLQEAVDRGEVQVPTRELESRLQLFTALTQ